MGKRLWSRLRPGHYSFAPPSVGVEAVIQRHGRYFLLLFKLLAEWCLCCNNSIKWLDREGLSTVISKINDGQVTLYLCGAQPETCYIRGQCAGPFDRGWQGETAQQRRDAIDRGDLDGVAPPLQSEDRDAEPFTWRWAAAHWIRR